MNDIQQILAERQRTHGNFDDNSEVAQKIKNVIRDSGAKLSPVHMEALDFVASKIGRICSGNANEPDHWFDGAGYMTLAGQRCVTPHPELPLGGEQQYVSRGPLTIDDLIKIEKEQLSPLPIPPGWRLMGDEERVDTLTRYHFKSEWIPARIPALGRQVTATGCHCITPDWHNPAEIDSPGEGYRFLLDGEDKESGDQRWWGQWPKWKPSNPTAKFNPEATYRTSRPLPCPPTTN